MEITIMRRKNTRKKSQFNFLLKEQDSTFKIDDWEIANNPEMILGRRNSDLVDDWLELFSDMPDSIADDQYVRVANNFLQKIGSRYRCVAKVSQNADGEITWKMTENLSEQSAPSMKKNILKENMRRFGTKNLTEQEELDDLFDIIMSYVKDPDDAEKELDNFLLHGAQGFSDAVAANVTRDPRFDKFKR